MNTVSAAQATPLPRVALVGAGRVAQALALALHRLGQPVVAVGSRHPDAVVLPEPVRAAVATRLCLPQAAVDQADLVLLTVPDDQIGAVAAQLRWRAGQAVVHCSGATEVAVLAAAADVGARIGGFHPLQIFSDPVLAAERLAGSTVALEAANAQLLARLQHLAVSLGLHAITLPPGMRARYHAAAGYAASFLLPVLQQAVALWASFGVAEPQALQALLPLAQGTLAAVQSRGLAGALSGPISRGDAGVVQGHLQALTQWDPHAAEFYRHLALPQVALAQQAGRLEPAACLRFEKMLQNPPVIEK